MRIHALAFAMISLFGCATPEPAKEPIVADSKPTPDYEMHIARADGTGWQPTSEADKARAALLKARRDEQKRRDDEAMEKRAEARRARDAEQEAFCASDRADRAAEFDAAIADRDRRVERRREIEAYAERFCRKVTVKDYDRVACDDGTSVVKVCNSYRGEHEEFRCPAGAPKELMPGGVLPGPFVTVPYNPKNDRCGDVPDERARAALRR